MSRFVVRQGELDDMDSQQVLPVADTGGGEEEWDGSNQPAMPGTAEEYLRMVRRQAHGIPDVVCRPLAPTQPLVPVSVRLPAAMSDIEECADVLLPSIEWERSFLRYFDLLRARVDAARVLDPCPPVLEQAAEGAARPGKEAVLALPDGQEAWMRPLGPA
ncbi:hypothetical protein T484DRAFT_1831943 [Baffinella frigidus]|nr:hypothetical protein T484DRAFT_1831943 [Cryptophyta sp. CCMP2293]